MHKLSSGTLVAQIVFTLLLGAALGCNGSRSDGSSNDTKTSVSNDRPSGSSQQPSSECRTAEIKTAYEKLANDPPVAMDATKVGQWPGLDNLGNTCFINASLKLLAAEIGLNDMLNPQDETALDRLLPANEANDRKNLRRTFKVVMSMIRLGDESPAKKIPGFARCSLGEFHDAMKNIGPLKKLACFKQEDATEFMAFLVDTLSLDREAKGNTAIEFLAVGNSADRLSDARFLQDDTGKIVEQASNYMLQTGAPPQPKIQTVAGLFRQFTSLRYENNALIAPSDKKPHDHMAQTFFTGIPKSVRILISSVDVEQGKKVFRKELVSGPEQLTLTSYSFPTPRQQAEVGQVTSEADLKALMGQGRDHQLSMRAVVVHRGATPNGGHYLAYVKDASGVWFEHNDTRVSEYKKSIETIEQRANEGEHAYLYLYEQ